MGAKSNATLQARIKKMMQSDEDVGKVSKASPVLIGKALEVFLQSVVDGAAQIAASRGAKMLMPAHIKAHVEGEELLDFLKDAVAAAPALPPVGSVPAKPKRQRARSESGEGGPAKVHGRSGRGGRSGKGRSRGARGENALAAATPEAEAAGHLADHSRQQAAGLEAAAVAQQLPSGEQAAGAGEADAGTSPGDVAAAPVAVPGFLASAAMAGTAVEEDDYDV